MTPKQIAEAWLYLYGDGSYFRFNEARGDGKTAQEQLDADRRALTWMIQQAIDAAVAARKSGCPCTLVEPCSYACSCGHPMMSGGCTRCCRYGSEEQRLAAARRLASIDADNVTPFTVVDDDGDQVVLFNGQYMAGGASPPSADMIAMLLNQAYSRGVIKGRHDGYTRAFDEAVAAKKSGCPCTMIEPCSSACTCAHPMMSGGCSRCCRFGSEEQRLDAAKRLASNDYAVAAEREACAKEIAQLPEADSSGSENIVDDWSRGHKCGLAGGIGLAYGAIRARGKP